MFKVGTLSRNRELDSLKECRCTDVVIILIRKNGATSRLGTFTLSSTDRLVLLRYYYLFFTISLQSTYSNDQAPVVASFVVNQEESSEWN